MPKKKTIAARRAPERRRAIQVLGIQAGLRFLAGAIDPAAQNRGFAIIGRAQVQHDGECQCVFRDGALSQREIQRSADTKGLAVPRKSLVASGQRTHPAAVRPNLTRDDLEGSSWPVDSLPGWPALPSAEPGSRQSHATCQKLPAQRMPVCIFLWAETNSRLGRLLAIAPGLVSYSV